MHSAQNNEGCHGDAHVDQGQPLHGQPRHDIENTRSGARSGVGSGGGGGGGQVPHPQPEQEGEAGPVEDAVGNVFQIRKPAGNLDDFVFFVFFFGRDVRGQQLMWVFVRGLQWVVSVLAVVGW